VGDGAEGRESPEDFQELWEERMRQPPVSSNGTESYATHHHHAPASLNSSGLRKGRSSPRATASDSAKEYRP